MKVLYIGGTGTVGSACVAGSARRGMDVHVLNRGRTVTLRPMPATEAILARPVEGRRSAVAALAP